MSVLGQSLNLLSSILTILLTCPNSDTLVCYSNDPFLTVQIIPRKHGGPLCFLASQTEKLVHMLPGNLQVKVPVNYQFALLIIHK